MPGSRAKEIGDNLPQMLSAARILTLRGPRATGPRKEFEFIIPLAPTLNASQRKMLAGLVKHHGDGLPVQLVDDARAALLHARASVVASGTATVEAALIGNPFVVVYRVSPLTYEIARRVVKVPYVAMANLIAGKMVVPELIQTDFTAANIVRQIEPLLPDGPLRESMMKELARIRGASHPRQPGRGRSRNRHKPGRRHHNQADRQCLARLRIRAILSCAGGKMTSKASSRLEEQCV